MRHPYNKIKKTAGAWHHQRWAITRFIVEVIVIARR
jgi:hypothetical protein